MPVKDKNLHAPTSVHAVARYIIATVLAVIGGYIGYHLPHAPLGIAGNELFVAGLFGLATGLAGVTGFLGNAVNALLLTAPLLFLPGHHVVIAHWWFWGNLGYTAGNVLGQLSRLAASGKIEARAL
jgi:hypothetical protein